ncbi:MAG: DUF1080 domain-containing protein [Gloeobacteraceae cyanobacterium ES-bin-144]|nr:DUF1080 domain-containing protein [Verrucomicrobiales bacterium]
MNSISRLFIPVFLFLGVLQCKADWQILFNGKDLKGWSGDPRIWRVENGVLIGETNDSDKKITTNSFLIWQGGEPADFTLDYKSRVVGNNSGVQYRSKVLNAATWRVTGYQMDLHPNAPYLGMLYEEGGRGIACQRGQRVNLNEKPEETGKLEVAEVKLEEWNSYRIVVSGHVLRHYVNDKLAAEIDDVNADKRSMKGVIALQVHAGPSMKTEFKDLKIQIETK